jgi:hypothetical protein
MFTDVNLDLYCDGGRKPNALIQFLPKLLPLITSIESIKLYENNMLAHLGKEIFGREMLTSARVVLIRSGF